MSPNWVTRWPSAQPQPQLPRYEEHEMVPVVASGLNPNTALEADAFGNPAEPRTSTWKLTFSQYMWLTLVGSSVMVSTFFNLFYVKFCINVKDQPLDQKSEKCNQLGLLSALDSLPLFGLMFGLLLFVYWNWTRNEGKRTIMSYWLDLLAMLVVCTLWYLFSSGVFFSRPSAACFWDPSGAKILLAVKPMGFYVA